MSVRPSVRMEQFDPHYTDFPEIRCLIIIRQSIEKNNKFNQNM